MKKNLNQSGFVALTTMLVISAVALFVSISISLMGVSRVKNSLDFKKGQETMKIAEGCAEEALIRLRNDVNYTGESLSIGSGSCTIVISGAGSDRNIDVEASLQESSTYIKRLQLTVKRKGNSINIISWDQV